MDKTHQDDQGRPAATSLRAGMEEKAIKAVLDGAHWLTAQAVGARCSSGFARDTADRWHAEGRVFAVECAGETFYPSYVFDAQGNPIPEVKEILKVLKGYRPFRIASWFESTNSMLRGRRPREVLASTPSAVLEAARDHVAGARHG